jgi:hypothetical protein
MPLSEPATRKLLHTRAVQYRGYERKDEMWDIEAHMIDTKTYDFSNNWRGQIEAGEPLHEMLLRVTIDSKFVIREIVAATDNSPFQICPDITANYQSLIGIQMGRGWRKEIRKKVGGCKGCTHLTELLFPMATVAMQTIWPRIRNNKKPADSKLDSASKKPMVLDTCHAWASDSPVVKELAPKFYTGGD